MGVPIRRREEMDDHERSTAAPATAHDLPEVNR
ncbi:MAG: hypothetical protein JWQ67_2407 [Marmoricola sp.]|nr:hypothetical protein [Marmoricola sp.]